jgi:hypothetical protein
MPEAENQLVALNAFERFIDAVNGKIAAEQLDDTGNRMISDDIMLPMSEYERVMRLDLCDMAAGQRGKSIPEHWADVVEWASEPRSAKFALPFAACILGTHELLSFVARCRKET